VWRRAGAKSDGKKFESEGTIRGALVVDGKAAQEGNSGRKVRRGIVVWIRNEEKRSQAGYDIKGDSWAKAHKYKC